MTGKILKFLKLFFISLAGLLFAYGLTTLILSYAGTDPEKIECDHKSTIYVATNGVHLYIILPVINIQEPLVKKLPLNSRARYASFGWGDKEFYINTPEWSDLTFGTAFRALFTRSETAMHVTLYNYSYDFWEKVAICPVQLSALNDYIFNSFRLSNDNNLIPVETLKYSADDFFYTAKGNYSVIKTSNVWVNKGLKEADIKTSVWSPFDFGVLHHLHD